MSPTYEASPCRKRALVLPAMSPRLTWDNCITTALPDGPCANGGFEIAAVDLSAPLGEL